MFAVGIIDELAEGHAGFGGRTAHNDSDHCQKDRTDCDGSQHCFEVSSETHVCTGLQGGRHKDEAGHCPEQRGCFHSLIHWHSL